MINSIHYKGAVDSQRSHVIVDALEEATQEAASVLAKNNIKMSKKEIREAFIHHPALQGSLTEVQANLIQLGKLDGPIKDNRSAFAKGCEKVFITILNSLVSKAYAGEISEQHILSYSKIKASVSYDKQSQKKEASCVFMAFRALRGDRSPEIIP